MRSELRDEPRKTLCVSMPASLYNELRRLQDGRSMAEMVRRSIRLMLMRGKDGSRS